MLRDSPSEKNNSALYTMPHFFFSSRVGCFDDLVAHSRLWLPEQCSGLQVRKPQHLTTLSKGPTFRAERQRRNRGIHLSNFRWRL